MNKENSIRKRPFAVYVPDRTAVGGVSKLIMNPLWDFVPSTGEPVNTYSKARQYVKEVISKEQCWF